MKKSIGMLAVILSLSLSADVSVQSSCDKEVTSSYKEITTYYPDASAEEESVVISFATVIKPSCVKEVTTYYPDASAEEESVVTSFVTVFKGSPSKVVEIDLDSDVGILY